MRFTWKRLFEETPRTSFHLGNEFVVTSSLTKAFGLSGLRCGWIFAEPELARRMWLLNDLFASTPVHAGERLSVVAMQQLAEIGGRAKQLLDRNRRILNEFLDTREDLEVSEAGVWHGDVSACAKWDCGRTVSVVAREV